ncbi:MAG: DUF488 domain-containing protein [Solirubrobacteraceae bacterium]
MRQLVTIGVYDWDPASFLAALRGAEVRLLLDLRQRRGVRGPQYAWANSLRLQESLARAGVGYRHRLDLAPTTELRHLQYAEDARRGVGKRSRVLLAPEYARRYEREILDRVDLGELAREVAPEGSVALFCVERDPEACHRSLVAARLSARLGADVRHLRP